MDDDLGMNFRCPHENLDLGCFIEERIDMGRSDIRGEFGDMIWEARG